MMDQALLAAGVPDAVPGVVPVMRGVSFTSKKARQAGWLCFPDRAMRASAPEAADRTHYRRAGNDPALASMEAAGVPRTPSNHRAVSMAESRSMPVATPERCSKYSRSSVAMLPVARGANGQPPSPPTLLSSTSAPASKAAQALAMPVLRVL